MTRNDSDPGWIGTEEVRGSTLPWRKGDGRPRQRQPINWPTAAFGLGVLAFFGWLMWLLANLIRDLAG